MPVIPENIADLQFDERDLYLDVRLSTISNEGAVVTDPDTGFISQVEDFTGLPTFKTGFFRRQIGFGITNVKIETNTSLQPIVEVEFKDLFGKTVFGETYDVDADGVNYAALFQWPPPKFVFTFKGYLGAPVTWLLNMKTTSTQYNSDDGSYTIKATFVPNQWGMFADIPFLYLYAAKKLRADRLDPTIGKDSKTYIEATESIIDLMYIGKTIEVETSNLTKEYDEIVAKLQLAKRDPIQGVVSGELSFNKDGGENIISSKIPGRGEIPDFVPITLTKPKDNAYKEDDEILLPALKNLSPSLRNIENWKVKIASTPGVSNVKTPKFGSNVSNADIEKLKTGAKKLNPIIDSNLEIIENAIKANLYKENKSELKKLTISEVFSRIARDTAYIMGYIIDAGEQGYLNNVEERNKAEENKTIGRYYPMIFDKPKDGTKDLGNQIPAKGLGTEDFEKKFVNDFITAISFGIAENRALQKEADTGADKTIKHIINNMEIGTDNPYLGQNDWSMIASIMVKRAGIAGFLTQSFNPALPGNLEPNGNTRFYFGDYKKNQDYDKVRSLASSDLANITDVVLAQLDTEGLQKLKEFCIAIRGWIQRPDADLDATRMWNFGSGGIMRRGIVINPGLAALATSAQAKKIINFLRDDFPDLRVITYSSMKGKLGSFYDNKNNVMNRTNALGTELTNAGVVMYTYEEIFGNLIGPEKAFFGQTTKQKNGEKGEDGVTRKTYVSPTWGNGMDFKTSLGSWVGMGGVVFAHTAPSGDSPYGSQDEGNFTEYVVFSDSGDVSRVGGALENPGLVPTATGDEEEDEQSDNEPVEDEVAKIITLDSARVPKDPQEPDGSKTDNTFMLFFNKRLYGYTGGGPGMIWGDSSEFAGDKIRYTFYDYKKASNVDTRTAVREYFNPQTFAWRQYFGPTTETTAINGAAQGNYRNIEDKPVVIAPYAQYPSRGETNQSFTPIAGGLMVKENRAPYGSTRNKNNPISAFNDEGDYSQMSLVFLRKLALGLLPKIQKIQDEVDKVFGQILGKAGEHEDLIYKQMHTLFHQWQILGGKSDGSRINQPGEPATLTPNVAEEMQKVYGRQVPASITPSSRERNNGSVLGGGFRYDYPLQAVGASKVKVKDALISLAPLYSAKANTTTLNMFQQLCTKNNFMFFPICGNARYDKVTDIFKPHEMMGPRIGNFFQVMFQPTPESRTLVGNDTNKKQSAVKDLRTFEVQAFPVAFGDPTNKIIKNVQVSTDENKVTAESIVNLQAIVDNDNKNKTVTTDCSLLSVFEGRSYKAGVETIGNSQISPLQFFFLENHTIFTGLYQIIKVTHKISPNDMTTDLSGIKMRYGGNSYGGVLPITLQDFEDAAGIAKEAPLEKKSGISAAEEKELQDKLNSEDPVSDGGGAGGGAGDGTGGNYAVTGTDKGSKTVASYLRNKTKKRRIDKIIKKCVEEGITSNFAIASVLSICSKESSFDLKSEGFLYSASRLPEVWSYFKKNDPVKGGFVNPKTKKADSDKYQEKIANIVYTQKPVGIRSNGYGNTRKGDGWKYRGRGYNQITFKSGYEKAAKNSGVDLIRYPERLLEEDVATAALVGFFNGRRRTSRFGTKKTGYTTRQEGYGCPDNGVTFPDLKNAVFFYYHLNTGPGKTVATVKKKLSPNDKLGGMRRAQGRAPAFVEYINKNFAGQGVTILKEKG
jgi:predicted chitinase